MLISTDEAKQILNRCGDFYTDQEVDILLRGMEVLCDLEYDIFQSIRKNQKPAMILTVNNKSEERHETSDHLHAREH